MKLYHGTSESVAKKALVQGIKPRGRTKGNWEHTVLSNPRAVYLTDAYAPYFAAAAVSRKGDRWAIIEVDTDQLDTASLVPDEDVLAQSLQDSDQLEGNLSQRSRHYRRVMDTQFAGLWRESLKAMGTCAHMGSIPPEAITRVAYFDSKKDLSASIAYMDPSISLMNYKILGDKYRWMTALLFGEEDRVEVTPFNRSSNGWFLEQMRYDFLHTPGIIEVVKGLDTSHQKD